MIISSDLDRRFREAAVALDLVDMGFDVVDTPIGPLFVAASTRGLAAISFESDPDDQLERLARIAGPCVLRSPKTIDAVRRELDEYFTGRRRVFDLSRSTCARCPRSPSPSSASSPASPTARRRPTARSRRASASRASCVSCARPGFRPSTERRRTTVWG
jgi:hypothetical protein